MDETPAPPTRWPLRMAVLALVAVTLLTFGRAATYEFINWDDLDLVVNNKMLNPVTAHGVASVWNDPAVQAWTGIRGLPNLYTPVAYTVWACVALIARLPTPDTFGATLNPMVFHTLNVVLHTASVVITFTILFQLTRKITPALLGAMVFAVHPLQVEPVCWISGMNNVLAGLFSLACIAAYVRFTRAKRPWTWYLLAVLMLVLALLSKPTAVVTPLVLLAMDAFILRRPLRKIAWSIAPLLAVNVPFVLIGRLIEPGSGAFRPDLPHRIGIVLDTFGFYLSKLVWPYPLLMDYARTPEFVIAAGFTWQMAVAIGAAVLVLITCVWLRRLWPLGAAAMFVVAVLPVSGIVPFVFQMYSTVADRYLYIAMFAVAVMISLSLSHIPQPATRRAWTAAGVVIAVLVGVNLRQNSLWHDGLGIAQYTIDHNPRSFAPYDTIGYVAQLNHQLDTAEQYFREGLTIRPWDQGLNLNLGCLIAKDHPAEAIEYLQRGLDQPSPSASGEYWLGYSYFRTNQFRPAEKTLRESLRLMPDSTPALATLGYLLATEGRIDEARQSFNRALKIDPNFELAKRGLQRMHDVEAATQPALRN